MNKKILVAMSGGPDSAVAAALLKTQGYEVIGVHLQLWDVPADNHIKRAGGSCCSNIPLSQVKQLCKQLEIPLYVINARDEYQNEILEYAINETLQGRVPNPCARCNGRLKFTHLIQKADELKCDLVATGHYAKSVRNPDDTESNLYRAADPTQDQSYYLFELTQDQLKRLMMPIGDLLKNNVRKMAYTFNIKLPEKEGPRSICLVGSNGCLEYIAQNVPDRYRMPGPITDQEGRILGRHRGLYQYWVGQKDDLGIDRTDYPDYCVLGFDLKVNALITGPTAELPRAGLIANNCNWIGLVDFSKGKRAKAKISPNHEPADCVITLLNNNSVLVDFLEPQPLIRLGQAIVFFEEDLVLGGGWIEGLTQPVHTKLRHRQQGAAASQSGGS